MSDPKQLAKLEFVAFCIEQYKKAANISGGEAEQLFSQRGVTSSLNIVYTSPVYAKLEQERTKYWWLGINALYQDIVQHKHF